MPVPILGSLAGGLFHGAIDALNPLRTSAFDQLKNSQAPNCPPSPSDLLRAYWNGELNHNDLQTGLKWSAGISIVSESDNMSWDGYWRSVIRASVPTPSIELGTEMWRQEWLSDDQYNRILTRNGLIDPAVHRFMRQRSTQLDVTQIIALYRQGLIDDDKVRWLMYRIGVKDDCIIEYIARISQAPSPQEINDLLNRGTITPAIAADLYGVNGIVNPEWIDLSLSLRNQIPGASDLVRFALREGWDQQVVDRFQYDAEWGSPSTLPFQYWMEKQGFGWQATVPGANSNPTWPQLYWRAHWQAISPGQAYEFLHRFRVDNQGRRPKGYETLPPFSQTDVNTVLKIADYAPGFREYLAAASFRVLGRIDVRRMFSTGTLKAGDLPGRYMDQGHSEGDANLLADFTVKNDLITRQRPLRTGVRSAVLSSYKTGVIDRATASRALYRISLVNPDDLAAFDRLDISQQDQLAAGLPEIQVTLSAVDLNVEQAISNQSIAAIRKAFLRLELDSNGATLTMRSLGIAEPRIQQYLRLWQYQFLGRGKTLAAAQILRYVVRGAILPAIALDRLVKLGYTLEDAILMLDVAQQDIALAQAKAAAKAAKDAETAKRAQERVVQEQQRALRQAQSDLARHGSPKELAEWLARELVSQDEFDVRMNALGWPEADRQRLAAKTFGATKKRVFNETDLAAIEAGLPIPSP